MGDFLRQEETISDSELNSLSEISEAINNEIDIILDTSDFTMDESNLFDSQSLEAEFLDDMLERDDLMNNADPFLGPLM